MTPKRTAFIAEYLICRNASEAARRAGYSAKRADAIGYDLLRNTEIRAAVDARLQEVAEKAGLSVELVRASLVRELNFDPAKAFNADGSLKQIHEMDPDTRKGAVVGGDGSGRKPGRPCVHPQGEVEYTQSGTRAGDEASRYVREGQQAAG